MRLLLISLFFLIPIVGWSQGDLPDAKPLKIEAANKLDKDGETDKGTALRIPAVIKEQPKFNFKDSLYGRRPVQMIDERGLVQAGTGMKIDPKVGPRTAKEGSKNHLRSFIGLLQQQGVSYDPQFISQELFDAIID